eukprot:48432-Prorocentrum_lima.AAC.1
MCSSNAPRPRLTLPTTGSELTPTWNYASLELGKNRDSLLSSRHSYTTGAPHQSTRQETPDEALRGVARSTC